MSLFSSVAGIFGASKAKKAIKQASLAQQQAAQQGIDAVTSQNAATQQAFAPYLSAGTTALGAQTDLLGLNGTGVQGDAISALKDSPLFKTLFDAGEETILSNASATGGLRGGNTQRSLADFGSDTLTKVIQQQLERLGGLSGQGLSAAGTAGQIGAGAADTLAQLFGNQGTAKAGGILGRAQASQELYKNLANLFQEGVSAISGFPGLGGIKPISTVSAYAPLQGISVDQTGGPGFRAATGFNL